MDLRHSNLYDLAGALANASQAAAGDGGAVERWAEPLAPDLKQYVLELTVGYCMKDLHEPPLMDEEFRKARRELLAAIFSDAATTARGLKSKYSSDDIPCFASKFRVDVKQGMMMEAVELAKQVTPDQLTTYQKRKLQWVLDHAAKMKTPDAPQKN